MEGDGETDRGTHGSGGCCMGKTTKVAKSNAGSEAELKALTHSILKKIKEKQLEALLQAVESKGGARSPCLLLPSKVDAKVGQQSYSLPMLLYKVFRWPDLRHSSELKRLSCCESYGKLNPELVCCNPHHMSRLCELGESGSPPSESSEVQSLALAAVGKSGVLPQTFSDDITPVSPHFALKTCQAPFFTLLGAIKLDFVTRFIKSAAAARAPEAPRS